MSDHHHATCKFCHDQQGKILSLEQRVADMTRALEMARKLIARGRCENDAGYMVPEWRHLQDALAALASGGSKDKEG